MRTAFVFAENLLSSIDYQKLTAPAKCVIFISA